MFYRITVNNPNGKTYGLFTNPHTKIDSNSYIKMIKIYNWLNKPDLNYDKYNYTFFFTEEGMKKFKKCLSFERKICLHPDRIRIRKYKKLYGNIAYFDKYQIVIKKEK